jgi:predicted Zn finger-like uncharacterized protein
MHLVCPKCATSYQLDAASLGATGRSVRCTRCKTVWFAAAPQSIATDTARDEAAFRAELGSAAANEPGEATEPQAMPPEAAAAGPAPGVSEHAADESTEGSTVLSTATEIPPALSDIKIPAADAPPLAATADVDSVGPLIPSEPGDIESVAARRMPIRAARRPRPARTSKLPLVILVLVAACTAIIGWRKDIVRHAPQMASFYGRIGLPVNVRGLVFTDVRIANETHDGVPVLSVEGTIASMAADAVEVPRLRFALRNAAGQEVYSWTAVPIQTVLGPGDTMPFRSRLASPPSDVHDVQVRFFTRRDAAAGAS